jgi:hypothetical protein
MIARLPPNREVQQDHTDDDEYSDDHEAQTDRLFCFFVK